MSTQRSLRGRRSFLVVASLTRTPLPHQPRHASRQSLTAPSRALTSRPAGIIGYRALARASLPPGGRLGIYGFGGSAHLAAQVAMARGARVHVMTRAPAARELALALGVASAGEADARPPEPLDAALLFAPVGWLVPVAMAALDRGGVLSIAGIHLSDVPPLRYEEHLFYEREIRSVTSNTRADGRAFLTVRRRAPAARRDDSVPAGRGGPSPRRPCRRPRERRCGAGRLTGRLDWCRLGLAKGLLVSNTGE